LAAPQSLFKYQSGRVIALGRVMLAGLFLVSIWLDQSQPAKAPVQTYFLLTFYVMFALGIAALTWRHWWLDARLAAPTHFIDMAVFTAIVFSTNGYTSPFFLFFVLPLLSAAIRWGWRETALTATALVLLYFSAGLLVAGSEAFELQRFIARSGHLMILSALLIWFGIHQRFTTLFLRGDELDPQLASTDEPLALAVGLASQVAQARSGALLMQPAGEHHYLGVRRDDEAVRSLRIEKPLVENDNCPAMLFNIPRDHALTKSDEGRFRFARASRLIDVEESARLGLTEGLIAQVRTGTAEGWLVLWDIEDLSTDYLEVGRELGRAVGAVLDHHALLNAIEAGAGARARLSLARDVHDSIVQFLAGAAFRVEAIVRAARSGAKVDSDLQELKRLLIEEQGEIRGFVSALRRDRELELAEAVEELRTLARRLGDQWSVKCKVTASDDHASIPIRLQLDLQQLLREAVANAVRHGGADRIEVGVTVEGDQLRLRVHDNGRGFGPANGASVAEPWSLKERIDRAHGSLMLVSEPGSTEIMITLPLSGPLSGASA
jgi:signal transduction histidine kinase